jgi:thermitase
MPRGATGVRATAVLLLLLGLVAAAPPADAQATGEGITVAILDSGVDGEHPELAGRVQRISFAPVAPGLPVDVGSLSSTDPNGQGTAVASIVAGATVGLAPQALILDLQVSPSYTGTTVDRTAEAAAIEAMDYLLQDPSRADVVLLSFASRGVSSAGAQTLASQAERLADEGVVVLVPSAPSMSALHASAAVLTVAAPDCPGGSARQSGDDQVRKPDLVAPASNLRAAAPGTPLNPGPTATVSGTPYAAAQAAGAAALVLDARSGLPSDATAAILRDSSADIGDPGVDDCNGFGLLSPEAAVQMAEAWSDPLERFPTKPTPSPVGLAFLGLAAAAVLARRRA